MTEKREQWGSSLGFILAAAGGAIGLGNIWKFPYVAGQNGGAAFIIIYLIAVMVIGFPVLIAEILVGRYGQLNPVGSYRMISRGSKFWVLFGYLGILTGFIILSYYNVVAGWSLGYVFEAMRNVFSQFTNPSIAANHYEKLVNHPVWIIGFQFLLSLITVLVVYLGVQRGIEKYSKILMPLFFFILLLLVIWGLILDKERASLIFLFKPDWSVVTPRTVLDALGQAFFSLSLGMGAMLTYGSYLHHNDNILKGSFFIALLDTLIAILAGIAIFAGVFAMGLSPEGGPGLVFKVLPAVFAKMPGGYFFGILFFVLLTIAAVTSAISLLEVIASYFVDEKKLPRHIVVLSAGIFTFLLGIPSALSFGIWSDKTLFGLNFFGILDFLSANVMLPIGGLAIALLIGWNFGKEEALAELSKGAGNWVSARISSLFSLSHQAGSKLTIGTFWFYLIKYLAPVIILLVFLNSLGLI